MEGLSLTFNKAFISFGGVTNEENYDFDMDECHVSEMMMKCSKEAILLTDSSKLNKKSVFSMDRFQTCPKSFVTKRSQKTGMEIIMNGFPLTTN